MNTETKECEQETPQRQSRAREKGTAHIGKLGPEHIESSLLSSEPPRHKRILVVDDNPDIVLTLRVGLESDPTIRVFSFDNPVTALVEFKPNFYDLLLIDVNMPLLDGFQLAQNFVQEGPQCQGLLYNCRRNKYGRRQEKCIH